MSFKRSITWAAGKRDWAFSETQLRERLNQLQELHILPEHRVQSDPINRIIAKSEFTRRNESEQVKEK